MRKNSKHHKYIPGLKEVFKFMGESHEEYEIPISSYNKLFGEYLDPYNYFIAVDAIETINRDYLEKIYDQDKYPEIIDYLVSNVTPTFRYHGAPYNGWRLELSGRNIIRNIYNYFGDNDIPNIYNTSKHDEKVALEEDSIAILKKIYDGDLTPEQKEFVKDTIININKITNINETKLDDDLRGKYEPKDLLFIIGFVSLDNYKKTGNALYLNFAKKYYSMVTKTGKPLEWPHWFKMGDEVHKDYEEFIRDYNEVMSTITDKKETDKKAPIRFGDAFIKAGSLSEEMASTDKLIEQAKNDPKISEESKKKELEVLKTLREKQEFFNNLGADRIIYGKDELFGYVGFVFDKVTVFEKFYSGKRMIKPAKDNAIYWMEHSLIDNMVFKSKQDILKFIKEGSNPNIGRIIHDKYGAYKEKVKTLVYSKKDV